MLIYPTFEDYGLILYHAYLFDCFKWSNLNVLDLDI
jgi:hypothetical protein